MAISYEEALSTLQGMFSSYTAQQLDAVLRHHAGHMENTVETLLNHGEGSPEELMRKLPSMPVGNNNTSDPPSSDVQQQQSIDADAELARQLAVEDEQRGNSSRNNRGGTQSNLGIGMASAMGANRRSPGRRRPMASDTRPVSRRPASNQPPAGTKGIGTHTSLPNDFLRIPGRTTSSSNRNTNNNAATASSNDDIVSASGPGGVGQIMSDEQLARMLQDELFQEELRNNPEFSHLAGRRNLRAMGSGASGRYGQTTGRSTYSGAQGAGNSANEFFDNAAKSISQLGDVAKRRFQDFAASWNDPNRQVDLLGYPVGGRGAGASQGNTSAPGNERRSLLSNDLNMDEDEGEELDFVGGHHNSGNAFEMNDVGDKKMD